MDVTPREHEPRATRTSRRRWGYVIVGLVVVGAAGFVLMNGLRNATVYYRNVDEAVEKREELGSERFRLQGTVAAGSIKETKSGVDFQVRFHGVSADVSHTGDPVELFAEGIPVVLEGRWEDKTFVSDLMIVKHDNSYEEDNKDRIREAESEVEAATAP